MNRFEFRNQISIYWISSVRIKISIKILSQNCHPLDANFPISRHIGAELSHSNCIWHKWIQMKKKLMHFQFDFAHRSTWATVRAGVGYQDASNSIKTLLSRCEAKPSWAIYQSSWGKCPHNKPIIFDVTFSLLNNLLDLYLCLPAHQLNPLYHSFAAGWLDAWLLLIPHWLMQIGADGRRSQIFLALSTAAEFRDHLSTFSDYYSSLGKYRWHLFIWFVSTTFPRWFSLLLVFIKLLKKKVFIKLDTSTRYVVVKLVIPNDQSEKMPRIKILLRKFHSKLVSNEKEIGWMKVLLRWFKDIQTQFSINSSAIDNPNRNDSSTSGIQKCPPNSTTPTKSLYFFEKFEINTQFT